LLQIHWKIYKKNNKKLAQNGVFAVMLVVQLLLYL